MNKNQASDPRLIPCEGSLGFPDIRCADALLAFVKTCFDKDADIDFLCSPDLCSVQLVDMTVENGLIYAGNKANAWLCEFERIVTPLEKKLEFLKTLPDIIAREHLDSLSGEQMYYFDVYDSTLCTLVPYCEKISKRIDYALERALQAGLDNDRAEQLKDRFKSVCNEISSMKRSENGKKLVPTDLDEVKRAVEQRDERITEALMASGVSANDTYVSATGLAAKGRRAQALDMFRKLGAYRDSLDKVHELDSYHKFDDIRSISGKLYLCSKHTPDPKAQKYLPKIALYDLFPINDGAVADASIGNPVHKVVATYADKIYYLSKTLELVCLDLQDNINRDVLLDGKKYIFDENTSFHVFNGLCKMVFAAKEQVLIEKGRNKGKLRPTDTDLLCVDLASEEVTLCDFAIEDIACVCDGCVFYNKKEVKTDENGKIVSSEPKLLGYDIASGKTAPMPRSDCKIRAVTDNRVIYTYKSPTPYNLTLCCADFTENAMETVLEKNILDYSAVYSGKVYFSVGAFDARVLCSVDLCTKERREIQRGIKAKSGSEIIFIREDWMYFKKEIDGDSVLARCRPDGTELGIVCHSFEKFACASPFVRGYVYYIDTNACLCRVLISGHGHKCITTEIDLDIRVLSFFGDRIYFARKEYVGKRAEATKGNHKKAFYSIVKDDKYSISIYSSELDGSDLAKEVYDVDYAWTLSASSLLLRRRICEKYIAKNRLNVLEKEVTVYDVLELEGERRISHLVSFDSKSAPAGFLKGVIPVKLKDSESHEKLPPSKKS